MFFVQSDGASGRNIKNRALNAQNIPLSCLLRSKTGQKTKKKGEKHHKLKADFEISSICNAHAASWFIRGKSGKSQQNNSLREGQFPQRQRKGALVCLPRRGGIIGHKQQLLALQKHQRVSFHSPAG